MILIQPPCRAQHGRDLDLPVYFGDAGSPGVLHSVNTHRAACAVITLDTPGANYRTVWALNKHFPGVKSYVRAHDVDHGINLEKAGATAVVPETLEPSLQVRFGVSGFRGLHEHAWFGLWDHPGFKGFGGFRCRIRPLERVQRS